MLFVCDIGNSSIKAGVYDGERLLFRSVFSAVERRTADDLAVLLRGSFAMHGLDPALIEGAIIASVVRPLTAIAAAAIELLMHVKPLVVGPGVKTGLNIKTDIPSQLGADIAACAVGALSMRPQPQIIISMGTATTFSGINSQSELCGVLIIPGIGISADALAENAAELPRAGLTAPTGLLGRNTFESMNSGIIYGNASMIDGLLNRIAAEWQQEALEVVVTGAYAELVLPYLLSNHRFSFVENLSLQGLKRIYQLNSKNKARLQ